MCSTDCLAELVSLGTHPWVKGDTLVSGWGYLRIPRQGRGPRDPPAAFPRINQVSGERNASYVFISIRFAAGNYIWERGRNGGSLPCPCPECSGGCRSPCPPGQAPTQRVPAEHLLSLPPRKLNPTWRQHLMLLGLLHSASQTRRLKAGAGGAAVGQEPW